MNDIDFTVKVMIHAPTGVHEDDCNGLVHLDKKYRNLEHHPDIAKYRPISPYGPCWLAKFSASEYFTWIKPVQGGTYESTDPVFLVDFR
ncbi:hypothetical protein [Thiomonas sp.]